MSARKDDVDLTDLRWLLDSEPSAENVARAEKVRNGLANRIATVDAVLAAWRGHSSAPAAPQEPSTGDRARSDAQTIASLVQSYRTNPASPYFGKGYTSRNHTDRLCRTLVGEIGDARIADITADDVSNAHAKWMERAASGEKRTGSFIAYALVTQLRTIVNYGAKTLKDGDCLRFSFVLRNIRFKVIKMRQKRTIDLDQTKAFIRVAHEKGFHSVALAQAFIFDCSLNQRDVIGEWVPQSEPGTSGFIKRGKKWVRGIRWNEISDDLILEHTPSKGQKVRISLNNKELVLEELKRLNPRPSSGPVVMKDHKDLPWDDPSFRFAWRQVAREAGIPDDVQNEFKFVKYEARDARSKTLGREAMI
jgi:hypothetical protein